jgi:hypothetical protein
MKTRKLFIGSVSFLTMACILVLMLQALNWLPSLITPGHAKRYDSIEALRQSLGIKNVPVPTYFTENISWPPSLIIAQDNPYPSLAIEFDSSDSSENMLFIVRSPQNKDPLLEASVDTVNEEVPYELDGKSVLLVTGICRESKPCSMITWEESGQQTSVLLYSSPFELIKIVESMHH